MVQWLCLDVWLLIDFTMYQQTVDIIWHCPNPSWTLLVYMKGILFNFCFAVNQNVLLLCIFMFVVNITFIFMLCSICTNFEIIYCRRMLSKFNFLVFENIHIFLHICFFYNFICNVKPYPSTPF
jgi:hypothetical protein